jgi:hypothetical protein
LVLLPRPRCEKNPIGKQSTSRLFKKLLAEEEAILGLHPLDVEWKLAGLLFFGSPNRKFQSR